MKNIFSLIFAGMIGGLTCFGAMHLFNTNEPAIVYSENQSPKAVLTSTTSNAPTNFTLAANKAIPAVVHITAIKNETLASNRNQLKRDDPFGDMFGFNLEDLFGGGMGQGFMQPRNGTGSGVIISDDGYIVTNNHVVGFADEIKVILSDKREYVATKVGTDPSTDLAVIKIQATNLPTIDYGNSDDINIGEWVLAVGNPFSDLESTVTAGIVSAKGRDFKDDIIQNERSIEEFIQTDAAVNPGNSGGALVDTEGNLIGINTAIASPTGVFAGYSFAIPVNLAKKIVRDIQENGNIERANLGIKGYDIDADLVEEKNLNVKHGIYVAELEPGSGAQFSGVLPGDVVIKANDREVKTFEDIRKEMKYSKVGDVISLGIIRKGAKMTIPVKIKKRA